MPVRIEPTSIIKVNLGIEPNGKVQTYLTERCYAYMDKYVPKDNGLLREIVTIDSDSITYEQPYAYAQYIGVVNGHPIANYTTPGTGPYWDERMKSVDMQAIVTEVQNYINRGGN